MRLSTQNGLSWLVMATTGRLRDVMRRARQGSHLIETPEKTACRKVAIPAPRIFGSGASWRRRSNCPV